VAEDRREDPFRIRTRQGELVGVAHAGRLDLDQHFAGLRPLELDGGDFKRLSGLEGYGGTNVHDSLLEDRNSQICEVRKRRIVDCAPSYVPADSAANDRSV
jgi:hypothetical protein